MDRRVSRERADACSLSNAPDFFETRNIDTRVWRRCRGKCRQSGFRSNCHTAIGKGIKVVWNGFHFRHFMTQSVRHSVACYRSVRGYIRSAILVRQNNIAIPSERFRRGQRGGDYEERQVFADADALLADLRQFYFGTLIAKGILIALRK
jgi:hypothetical protein